MKKLVLTLTATLACLGAFAQGKIGFQNDSNHLVYFGTSDPTYGGQLVGAGAGPAGVSFMADLYIGTVANALSLVASTTFGAVPGKWNSQAYTSPNIPTGTRVFVEAQIRDSNSTPSPIFTGVSLAGYYGASQEFQFTMGGPITAPVMWGPNGNWANGSQALAGGLGAISVSVPEPASFALAGLGAAMLVIFRRRK